jgi:biopolymer transport protein ExbB/TolQ
MRRSATRIRELDWTNRDIEQRLFPGAGGRYTRVNGFLSGLIGILLAVVFYASLATTSLASTPFGQIFLDRGPTQHAVVVFFFWSLVILLFKWMKLRLQRQALDVRVLPDEPGFVISKSTVEQVLRRIHEITDDPRNFMILNRVEAALSNLRNLGAVGDVEDILRSQAAQDESQMETSYAIVQGFVWAIPVLGFIGTVLGLSMAIGSFTAVLGTGQDVSAITGALGNVTAGLATAFDTTLVALVAALVIQLLMVMTKKSEEEFLDEAMEYGLRNVVGRLRLESPDGGG